jgi:hypothetical protein
MSPFKEAALFAFIRVDTPKMIQKLQSRVKASVAALRLTFESFSVYKNLELEFIRYDDNDQGKRIRR